MARSTLATKVAFFVLSISTLGALGCAHGLNAPDLTDDGQNPLVGADGTGGSGGSGGSGSATGSGAGGGCGSGTSTTTTTTSTTTSTTTTTTTTSTSSGGGVCDGSGDCGTCGNCAINGACFNETSACFNDPDCSGLVDCLQTCQDDACANACAESRPAGVDLYMNLITCVLCVACPVDCQGPSSGACQ
ncbi:MAG: hypothetical protein U0359_33355 [Byssovorax sp.]